MGREFDTSQGRKAPPDRFRQIGLPVLVSAQRAIHDGPQLGFHGAAVARRANTQALPYRSIDISDRERCHYTFLIGCIVCNACIESNTPRDGRLPCTLDAGAPRSILAAVRAPAIASRGCELQIFAAAKGQSYIRERISRVALHPARRYRPNHIVPKFRRALPDRGELRSLA